MITKKTQELLKECDTQVDSLFTSFGRLLYENIQAGAISYYFDPTDGALTTQAKRLIRDIVAQKISNKKPTPRFSQSKAQDRLRRRAEPVEIPKLGLSATSQRTAPTKASKMKVAVKPSVATSRPKAQKNKVAAILKGVKNVFLAKSPGSGTPPPSRSDRPMAAAEEKGRHSLGIERRGQLEPYTELMVDLRFLANSLHEVRRDFNDCISGGLLHVTGERTAAYQAAVDEKIQTITLLMEKKREVIKFMMEKKKQFFTENTESTSWKTEEDFLARVDQDVVQTTKRIDVLIDEVVGLFKNIKEVYEKDLEEGRLAREKEKDREALRSAVPQPITSSEDSTESPTLDECPFEENSEKTAVEESSGEEVEEFPTAEQGTEEGTDDIDDYGFFETASRKLKSEIADNDEKLTVLHTLFRNAPQRAVLFLYELVRDADIFSKRQLLSLLSLLDYPTMVGLYRRFITDENSSLRLAGMMGLVKLGSVEAKHVVLSAIGDHAPHVRRFIVNYLEHTGGEPEATAIASLANDSDESVARIAIRKLGSMANHFAFVNLVPKLEAPNIKIRKEAIMMLKVMAGTDLGYDYAASESERERQTRPWKALAQESYMHPRLLRDLRMEHERKNKDNLPKAQSASRGVVRGRGGKGTNSRSQKDKRHK